VLLDLRLREVDGADVARELGVRTPQIPIVALSALDAPRADDMREAGFVGYLQKPISVARLPSQVRGFCGERPAPRG
jgi:two-component system, cell cycle response regulator DivK